MKQHTIRLDNQKNIKTQPTNSIEIDKNTEIIKVKFLDQDLYKLYVPFPS